MPKPFLPMTPTPPPRPPAEIVWAWKRGSGEFTPYDPETSARIEGAHAVGDKGVIIFLPAAYRIDFDKMCQINLGDESKRRSIVRLNALDATVEMPRRNSRTDGAVFDSPSKVRKALPFCSGSADMDMALLLSGGFDKQLAHRPEYTGATKSEAVPVGLSNKKKAMQSVEAAKRAGSKQGLSTAVLRKPLDYDAYGPKPSNDHQLSHYVDVELANYVLKRIPGPIPSGKYMQPIADALADDNARWLKSHKNGPSTGQERTAVAEIIASYESGRRSVFSGHKAVKVREQAAWLVENKDELHPAYVKHFAEVLNNCYGEEGEKLLDRRKLGKVGSFVDATEPTGPRTKKDGTPERYAPNKAAASASWFSKHGHHGHGHGHGLGGHHGHQGHHGQHHGHHGHHGQHHGHHGHTPTKKDGTPDMRYAANKAAASNPWSSTPSYSSYCTPSGGGGGSPPWYSGGGGGGSSYSGSACYSVSSNPTGPMKLDGTPDMRYSANRG